VRATVRVSLGFLLWLAAAIASAQQIQFAEPVDLAVAGSSAQFDAYGRRFSLTLSDNERVLSKLPVQRKQQLQAYRLLRGTLDGQPGSWVRLTESPRGVEGAIWDGHDLYAVTTYREIAPYLTTPLAADPDQTVVYRLSDARDLLPQNFCALEDDAAVTRKQTALDQYHLLVADLEEAAEARITRQVEIALIADSKFAEAQSPDVMAAMMSRLNVVEGIFGEQVGVLVLATDVRVMEAAEDPFSATLGTTLLTQLSKYRNSTAAVRARGVAHLMTGKNLDGTTAGIAYVDSVCSAERGVSLSEQVHGTTISALIMAHELGHNFGAPHDGDAAAACANVTGGYIMSSSVTGFSTFSQCSVDVMHAVLETASCVTPADYADVGVAAPASVAAEGGLPFTIPFTVRSVGTAAAEDVVLLVGVPDNAGVTLESAVGDGASCLAEGLTARCSFGSVPAGETRAMSITARGVVAGNISAKARVSASNDRLTGNNSRDVTVNMRSGVDAAIALSTDAPEVALGDALQIFADVRSLRTLAVRNAVLSMNLNQSVLSASMVGASCSASAFSVTCSVAELPAGSERRLTVLTQTTAPGPLFAVASISASGDGDLTNNSGSASGWVQAARDVELTAGPGSVDVAVGGSYELPLLIRSRGPQPTGRVVLAVSNTSAAIGIDLIDSEGAACSQPDAGSHSCDLGFLMPGASHLVRLRVRGIRSGTADLKVVAEVADDEYRANNSATVQFRLDNPVDLGLLLASGGTGIEDQDIEGQVLLSSSGRQAAVGATLDIEIPEAGALREVAIHNGVACELLSRQRARCPLPSLARGAQIYVNYRAQFAEPGSYDVKFSLQTPGDTAADNDSLVRPIIVRPHNDIAVSGDLDLTRFITGTTRETRLTVTNGPRALASARFTARHQRPGVSVVAIRADTGSCAVDAETGGVCDFVDFAANSTRTVTVTWQADGSFDGNVSVNVSTTGDVMPVNNNVLGRAEVVGATDLELRVAASAAGATGSTLEFPSISVVNGAAKAIDTRLEVTLPAEVSIINISAANAICSGTAVLRCDFDELAPNSTSTVNLSVRASTRGNYVSSLKLTSLNDTNPGNDSRQVAFEISGSSGVATATKSGSSGGGGGAFEWLSLSLLAGIVYRRWRASVHAVRSGRSSWNVFRSPGLL
jgi:hypothetical protein